MKAIRVLLVDDHAELHARVRQLIYSQLELHLGSCRAAFRVRPEDLIVNRLARLEIRPDDIDYVISSHVDPDHAGYLDAFPRAAIVVQRSHLIKGMVRNEDYYPSFQNISSW